MNKKNRIDPSSLGCEIQEIDDGELTDVHGGGTNWWTCTNPEDCTDTSNVFGCTNEKACIIGT